MSKYKQFARVATLQDPTAKLTRVAEVFTPPPGVTLAQCFNAEVAALFVPCPDAVQPGWGYDGKSFTAPDA